MQFSFKDGITQQYTNRAEFSDNTCSFFKAETKEVRLHMNRRNSTIFLDKGEVRWILNNSGVVLILIHWLEPPILLW